MDDCVEVLGIVRELAELDPYIAPEYGDEYCGFCFKYKGTPHEDNCIWQRAVNLTTRTTD